VDPILLGIWKRKSAGLFPPMPPQYPKLPTCIYKGRHGFAEDQEPKQLKCDIGKVC